MSIGDNALTLVQMTENTDSVRLQAADSIEYPKDIQLGSPSWQKWTIETLTKSIEHGQFQGNKVIAALPPSEVFIDTIKISKKAESKLDDIIRDHLKRKNITPENMLIKHFEADTENILVMASDKTRLHRNLAIYEKAYLDVVALSAWPMANQKAYSHFWARRLGQDDKPVMLLDIGKSHTYIVICDRVTVYFAHASPVGAQKLESERMVDLLNSEMDMCRVKFRSIYKGFHINHLIFVSGHTIDKDIYTEIATRAQMQARIGDCLEAVGVSRHDQAALKSHAPHANWITAVGLSLS
jgi:Tfp pilus assembly PilM family ATPase